MQTRAKKLLSFQQNNGDSLPGSKNSQSNRDPYAGFNQVFVMPGGPKTIDTTPTLTKKIMNRVNDKNLNFSEKIGEILKDPYQQGRVVENVMNAYRHKDIPKGGNNNAFMIDSSTLYNPRGEKKSANTLDAALASKRSNKG